MANLPPIPEDIFQRLTLIAEYNSNKDGENNPMDGAFLINDYQPHVLTDFNLKLNLPEDHLAIREYQDVTTVPANRIPIFKSPIIGTEFPICGPNYINGPRNDSLLPILIAAQAINEDFRQYDIVSGRGLLRKIAMNNETYAVGVMRHGRTLLLRRYGILTINRNDLGFLFEEMCTPGYPQDAEYKYLIKATIGTFRTLLVAEIDAVAPRDNLNAPNNSLELKCSRAENLQRTDDTWLQTFLSGTTTLTVGHRSIDNPIRLLGINNYNTADLIDNERKIEILQHLHQVLVFLQANVQEDRKYILYRRPRDQPPYDMGLFLYEITDRNDARPLQPIPPRMLQSLIINSS